MRTATILAAGLLVAACNAEENRDATAPADSAMTGMEGGADTMSVDTPTDAAGYAQRAAISDMYEIEAGKLAIDRASSSETRAFARMMVEDHEASTRDLKGALAQADADIALPQELDAEHRAKLDVLGDLDGENFDRQYMNQQVAAHRQALALHRSFAERGDNPALQSFAREVVPVIEKHRNELERMGAMAGQAAGEGMRDGMKQSHPDAT